MKKYVILTNDSVKNIKPDDLIAVTIAEGGAMGDPGAIELVDKNLRIYYTHFGEIESDELETVIPFLKTLHIGLGKVSGLPKAWDYLYTGYGNYLFVLSQYKERILEYVQKNYKDTGMSTTVELYSHWYEALGSIIKKESNMRTVNFKSAKTVALSSIRDLFGISDGWELCAWPISYNESISFIFRQRADGDVIDNGGNRDYSFKIVTINNFDFSFTQTKEITLHGACLVSMFFWQNGYVLAVRDEDDIYSAIFFDKNEHETSKINLGPNISRLMVARDGRVAVGYIGTFPDNLPCFAIISPDGEILYECHEGSARACMDLTVDKNDSIWASCYPDVRVYEINAGNTVIPHQYPVASPDTLIPFDLNSRTATILSYSNDEVYVPVNYLYVDDELIEIRFDDLDPHDIEGGSAYGGLVVLLTKAQKLHFFKLDEISKALE